MRLVINRNITGEASFTFTFSLPIVNCPTGLFKAYGKLFYQGGTGSSGRVIEFNSTSWTTVFDHDYWVCSLEVYDGKLYAGTAKEILTCNGTDHETSFNATEGDYYVISMITYDNKIYIGMDNGYVFANPAPPKQTPRRS